MLVQEQEDPRGPGKYANELFTRRLGEATMFVPCEQPGRAAWRTEVCRPVFQLGSAG